MDNIILAIVVAIFGGVIVWFALRNKKPQEDQGSFLMLQNQMNDLSRLLDEKLGESTRVMNETVKQQFSESRKTAGESQELIKEITKELTHVKETSRQIVGFADQLKNLQDILQNPKQRGVLGEYYLETVLKNVLPPGQFKMQYKFENGDIVDAVIFLDGKKMLPIDSKFSLENYNRILETRDKKEKERLVKVFKGDLKNRIDETSKYIRPNENTMDFAFMFIPSEGIYYDLLVGQVGEISSRDLIEYAFRDKHVIIVSPTSFMAYLQTVLQGLRSLQIEEQATDIIKRVGELGRHIEGHESYMHKLGTSLGTTVSHFNAAHKELKKIDKDVVRITDKKTAGVDSMTLNKPHMED